MTDRQKIKTLLMFYECDIKEKRMSLKVLGKKSLPVLVYKFNELGEVKEVFKNGKWYGQKGEIRTRGKNE